MYNARFFGGIIEINDEKSFESLIKRAYDFRGKNDAFGFEWWTSDGKESGEYISKQMLFNNIFEKMQENVFFPAYNELDIEAIENPTIEENIFSFEYKNRKVKITVEIQ